MKRLIIKNKGFTLVECIVAIAAFAVITTMVLMIMAGTANTQQKSMKAEADLNQLVENVVRDESAAKMDVDTSKTLKMSVDGSTVNFSMTYNTNSGYKNFVKCPFCGQLHNNIDFMGGVYDNSYYLAVYLADVAAFDDHKSYKACYWFDPSYMVYICPDCGKTFDPYSNLKCSDCEETITKSNSSYDRFNGSFSCNSCGSSRVSDTTVTSEITTDSPFSVGNMQANALRYGLIEKPDADDAKTFMQMSGGTSDNFTAQIKYKPNTKLSLPGTYTLIVSGYNLTDSSGDITIQLPPCYVCKVLRTSEGADGKEASPGNMHATVSVTPPDDYSAYDKRSKLKITGITNAYTGASFWVEFKLTNYENNNSFDYDYGNEDGVSPKYQDNPLSAGTNMSALAKYWFNWSNSSQSFPMA